MPGQINAGSSSGAWALTLLALSTIPNRRVRIGALATAGAFLLATLVIHRRLFDVQHLAAAAAALAVLYLFARRDRRARTAAA